MKPNVISNLCACGVLTLASALLLAPPRAAASSGTMVVTTDTTLTEDHQGNILVNASKVTLDCAGHTVSGPGVEGFNGGIEVAGGLSGVTVRRCNVTAFEVNGIFGGGTDIRIEANVAYNNADHGIHLAGGTGFVALSNTCRANGGIGIVFTEASNGWIVQNTVEDNHNWAGIMLMDESHDNFVLANTSLRNSIGIVLDGATKNQIRFNNASSNDTQGIVLLRSANKNLVEFNTANQNSSGIDLDDGSTSNDVRNNQANHNSAEGFRVYQSNQNLLRANVANKNGKYGFVVFGGASFNTLIGNSGHVNGLFDGYDEGTGTGNVWKRNHFGKTAGF